MITEDIKNKLNWPLKKINSIILHLQKEESLERQNPTNNLNLCNAIYDRTQKLPEEIIIENTLKRQMSDIIETLPEKEKIIIKMRFGFNKNKEILKYKKIAKYMELTENEIKNIEEHVIKKLRILFKKNNLEEFI